MSTVLSISGLTHAYGRQPVLANLALEVAKGEFVALIGPNGSGKTTLLRSVGGVLQPNAGSVRIDGIELATDPLAAKARLGFAIDPNLLPSALSGRQCLALAAGARGMATVPEATLSLAADLGFLPWLERAVEEYSLGTRQKLGILCGLIGEPPLLVLDEPLNGLDPLSAYELKRYLARRVADGSAGVLLATHGLEVAERFITRAVLLLGGEIHAEWRSADLAALAARGESLETAMVATLREHPEWRR
jgi:ABC-2 type transport system ATP-binding protein